MSIDVCDVGGRGYTIQGHNLSARSVGSAATCCEAADVCTTAGVYCRHVMLTGNTTLSAAPKPKRPLELLPELP